MIRISELSVDYDTTEGRIPALKDINISIGKGTTCAVIGPSGSGKSTFLRCLAGLQQNAYSGEISVNNEPINVQKLSIGFMPQKYGLLPWKTVKENIEVGCRLRDIALSSRRDIENAIVQQLGLEDKLERFPVTLSGGEQQRVGLARMFLLQPDLLLMDEPFSALDVITRESIQKVFLALWEKTSLTTVFVTHFIEEAVFLGQQIVVFSASPGRVVSVIQNPFFARTDMYQSEDYIEFVYNLRKVLEKELNA